MTSPRDPLDDFIEAAARLLDLPLEAEWKPGVRDNLAAALRLAGDLANFPLPDGAAAAPRYELDSYAPAARKDEA
jgi:hypothetical protein